MVNDNGCSDGNCKLRIGECKGQHTNGGCRCLRDIPTPLRLRIERKLASVSQAAQLAAVTAERDEAVALLRKIQWEADFYSCEEFEPSCPVCYGMKNCGHEPGCKLAAIIHKEAP